MSWSVDKLIPWYSEAADGWKVQRAKSVLRKEKVLNKDRLEAQILSLTLRGVVENDPENPEGLVPADYGTYQIFEKDDLVFKLIDLDNVRTSRVGHVHRRGIMSSAYTRLRPSASVETRYIFWQFFDLYNRQVFNQLGSGVRSTLNADDVLNLPMLVPPLSQQKAIANFLDRETTHIDALIASKKRLMDLINEFFMSEIASVCDELPNVVPIKRVADTAYGLGQPPILSEPSEETVPIIRATNINRGAIESLDLIHARVEDLPLLRAPLLKEGEILVVRSGALTGDSARITGEWVGSAPGYDLRVTPKTIDSRLLAWQLLGPGVRSQLDLVRVRAAQPHLNAEDLGSVMVRAGSPADEAKVADRLDVAVARSWKIVESIRTQIDLLRERRQALITAAITGDLDIPEVAA